MAHEQFEPRTAVREEKRQAQEALGRSFCKSLAEPITNSDSSAKRRLGISHASGLIAQMFTVQKGHQLDTAALRSQISGKQPARMVVVEVVTAKSSGRPVGEIVVIDQAEGMSARTLREALDDIGGDKIRLSAGVVGRNLFGRGLSDVMRAHRNPVVQTYDGRELTIAKGEWQPRWTISIDSDENPAKTSFAGTFLDPTTPGTAVRFVIQDRKYCHIPDPEDISYRLANFYMLRLIASDPNVQLVLRQYRAKGVTQSRIEYDFPVGQVIESFSAVLDAREHGIDVDPVSVDFLIARSEHVLRPRGTDPDARENGLLIVDDLDAVYDLGFVDPDYEKADFLSHMFGVIRITGLRKILDFYLNSDPPSSPLRPDRDGFNRDNPYAALLLRFLGDTLRPVYERERKRLEARRQDELSASTRKRIDDALKHLNKYFRKITALSGSGAGVDPPDIKVPEAPVSFLPEHTKLVSRQQRRALLLVRREVVDSGAEVVLTATDGISVQPETGLIDANESLRWGPNDECYAMRLEVTSSIIGKSGKVTAIVEGQSGKLYEADLYIDDVLTETVIEIPETMEFRPSVSVGRPGRRNNLALYINPRVVVPGHFVRIEIIDGTEGIHLIRDDDTRTERIDVKLDENDHRVNGQAVLRVLVPWIGTSWNQHARVEASAKIGGGVRLRDVASVRVDEQEDGGFFRDVKYEEIDPRAPSQFAAGVITVNIRDPLNVHIFGESQLEFDRRLSTKIEAQQRLFTLLLEEASFRALQQLFDDNKLGMPEDREIAAIHAEIDKYKFESAVEVFRALTRSRP